MKLKNALHVLPLIHGLRKKSNWRPREICDFSFSNPVILPFQVPSELLQFAEIVRDIKPKILLEIGTHHGGTLCVMARLADPNGTIISVDLPRGEFGGGYKWFHIPIFKSFAFDKQKLHLLRGDSHSIEMGTQVRGILGSGGELDLLFIDGDHSYEGVKKDFNSYASLVRHGGIVAFHDIAEHTIQTCQVARFWNEIKTKYRHEEIIENPSQGWGGIGLLYM